MGLEEASALLNEHIAKAVLIIERMLSWMQKVDSKGMLKGLKISPDNLHFGSATLLLSTTAQI